MNHAVAMFFLHAPGCHACEEARPGWEAFKRANPDIPAGEVDLTAIEWTPLGDLKWEPTATPSYILRINSSCFVIEGSKDPEDLTEWARERIRWRGL